MTKYLKNSYLPDVRQVFDFMTIFPELSEKVSVVCVHPGPSVEVDPSFGAKEEANLVRLNLHTPQARKSENMKARTSFMVSKLFHCFGSVLSSWREKTREKSDYQ